MNPAVPRWIGACAIGALALACDIAAVAQAQVLPACQAQGLSSQACRDELAAAGSDAVLAQAERWIQAQRYADARELLEQLRTRGSRNTRVQQLLQDVQSLDDEAAWSARRAASAPQADVELTLAETRCTRLSGEQALAACDQVLASRPLDARFHVARGDLLLTLGRATEALAAYRAAAEREPGPALQQKIALAEAAARPAPPPAPAVQALDQQLAALVRARDQRLITQPEFERQRLALLGPVPVTPNARNEVAPTLDKATFGRYHALVVGIDGYRHLDRLKTAVHDARTIGTLLRTGYGFEVRVLADATRADIVEALDDYRNRLEPQDNLLIYYAGHGWLDTEADKGFWLPIDAHPDKRTQWVSNDTVRDALRALKAKHVLVVADSCFSGTLTRGLTTRSAQRSRDYLERMARLKARQVLTSGGLEPVADSSGSGHSPFAAALIGVLTANRNVLDATSLFGELRRPVALSSEQVPQFADIRLVGHQGGDFLFIRSDKR